MAVNWPNAPSPGDFYAVDGRVWTWNGEGWARVINAGQIVSVLSVLTGPFILLNNPEPLLMPIGAGSMVELVHI